MPDRPVRVELRDWCVLSELYDAPEAPHRLGGIVRGHPRKADGTDVATTRIAKVSGRTVTTSSGTVYELIGDPEPKYRAWLERECIVYDPENPIRNVTHVGDVRTDG